MTLYYEMTSKLKFLILLFLLSELGVKAQVWKGLYKHHDFECYKLEMAGYPTILAAKTCVVYPFVTQEWIKLKIKSPFNWGQGLSDGKVAFTEFDAQGRVTATDNTFLFGKDSWVYYDVLVDNGRPKCDVWLVLYEHNDFGQQEGKKKTLKLNLFKLPVANLPMNYNMQSYW